MSGHPFDLLMELKTHQIRLDCAALHLARDHYPGLNTARYVKLLDDLAADVGLLRPGLAAPLRYNALRRVLVDGFGLTGNRENYYDPSNCYLHHVLDTHRGIPITLSIVWIEVARRLKWPVAGVALPGHFIVRFDDPECFVLADPFNNGRTLSIKDCRTLVLQRFEDRIPFSRRYLRPVNSRGILARLLRNLRNAYLAADDLAGASSILRRMAALEPQNNRHLQDLAAVCWRMGDVRAAFAHLANYLRRAPNAHDSEHVRKNLRQLQAVLVAMN